MSQAGNASQAFAIALIALSGHGIWALLTAVLLNQLPYIALSLWGGSIADRYPRRTVLLWTLGILITLSMILGELQLTGTLSLGWLYAIQIFNSAVSGVFGPTESALVQEIVRPAVMRNAQLLNSVASGGGVMMGGALGSLLSRPELLGWLFAFNAASYLPALVVVWLVPVGRARPQERGMPAPYREAWQSLAVRPEAKLALMAYGIALFFFMNGAVLQPLIGHRLLGGARAYAWISMANGVGYLIITAAQAMGEGNRPRSSTTRFTRAKGTQLDSILGWVVQDGVCIVAYGAAFGLFPSICFMLASCWGSNAVKVTVQTLLVMERNGQKVESRLFGRLNAVMQSVGLACIMLGNLLAAAVADFWGCVPPPWGSKWWVWSSSVSGGSTGVVGADVQMRCSGEQHALMALPGTPH
ncbi:MFS transporter [Ktedonospora formicarum]|uniref:MFS transporter n=1 Tax=Ktedonospora formicarum TaxID=2778364 RepID=A0A8J3MUV3_9CHLR|nr:MFS transporter [Ktedonospora formicarum]